MIRLQTIQKSLACDITTQQSPKYSHIIPVPALKSLHLAQN